jgi:steroid delta-isomerase-like uncharacterized protein
MTTEPQTMHADEERVRAFMNRVWNAGDLSAIEEFVSTRYTIHSDPGDPWDGQELDREGFKQRLVASRAAFPDLEFEIDDVVCQDSRVALSWTMRGTNSGSLAGHAPSGSRIEAKGLTIYYVDAGRLTGHRQVVDRLAIVQQLRLTR